MPDPHTQVEQAKLRDAHRRAVERNALIDTAQAEIDLYTDYLTEHGPATYVEYQRQRSIELDAERR